jgi:3-phosphoshikimate 1-carboxyvinyltransferase
MGLPDLIEIVPPGPVHDVAVTVPGSKSITNRALVLAALADGEVTLQGALWSEDTQVMVDCLSRLGFAVTVEPDPADPANRTISVRGLGGNVPEGGTREAPKDLFVGNAGTAARFLAAMVCLGRGWYRLSGVPRMHERPQAALFDALRGLGYRVESANDRLPVRIEGGGKRPGECSVSVAESSQFASALLLAGQVGGWAVSVTGANADELPYVDMTRRLLEAFPKRGGVFQIEPDASSGSYFWGAAALLGPGSVRVNHWPSSGWQVDAEYPRFLSLPAEVSRERDLGDSIMTAITLAPFAAAPVRFTDLGRLRVQECERVVALRTELTKCGARVEELGDTLTVWPGPLHGTEVETYNDHRMAMCFATLGLKVPGVTLRNPACVRKTFPNFFQKLAMKPPSGPGVIVRHGRTGQPLGWDALFAD